jgi:hypothetical protein
MDEETRRAAAVVASVALVVAAVCVYSLSWTLTLAADNCGPHATALMCTTSGKRLAVDVPAYGAIAATVVGLFGAWVWPGGRASCSPATAACWPQRAPAWSSQALRASPPS